MRISAVVTTGLLAISATLLFSGCAGTDVGVTTPTSQSSAWSHTRSTIAARAGVPIQMGHTEKAFAKPFASSARMVYISDYNNNAVYGLDPSSILLIKITGLQGPQGLFVDGSKNLWVANTNANNIQVFPKGSVRPIATYNDANEAPVDVTVCPDGKIYAANITDDSVSVYTAGRPNPIRTLSDPNSDGNYFITCDAKGNVFVTYERGGPGAVDEYVGGKQSGLVTLPITLGFPGGIKPNGSGKLLVNDQEAQTITEYTEAGSPTGRSIATGSGDVVDIAVTRKGGVVGGADAVNLTGQTWSFPSGKPRRTYTGTFTIPVGFAFDPGQKGI